MSHRPLVLRTLCSVMAVGLLTTAGWFALETRRVLAELAEWRDARPAQFTVDLTQPGTYRGQLRTTLRRPHTQGLYLASGSAGELSRRKALRGLRGRVLVLKETGEEVYRGDLPQPDVRASEATGDGAVWLADLPALDAGEYTLEVRVQQPVAELRPPHVQIHSQYHLNRTDGVPARLSLLVAGITAATGLLLAVVATVAFRPHRL